MEIEKAIELIEKSERLVLFLPKEQTFDCLAATEVLIRILANRGKGIGLFSPSPRAPYPPEIFSHLSKPLPVVKEFVISLYTQNTPVSQLRYEKSDEKIDIIISPQSYPLEERLISYREGKILCDAAILMGVKEVEALADNINIPPEFFTETPLINIDISEDNKNYGEVNLVSKEKTSLSEIVYSLASALGGNPIPQESATLILAGILERTNNLANPRINADTFLAASELMRLEADLSQARRLALEARPVSLLQLFSRASIRSRLDQEQGVLWSFITPEDFEKTGAGADKIEAVLNHLEQTFLPQRLTVLLWQEKPEDKIQAMLRGDPKILSGVAGEGNGESQNSYLRIASSFDTFREGEEHISSLISKAT